MKFPTIDGSLFFNLGILLISAFVGWFTLLMGGAHLIEGLIHPNTGLPFWEGMLGVLFCVGLCVVGIFSIWITIGAVISLYKRYKEESTN